MNKVLYVLLACLTACTPMHQCCEQPSKLTAGIVQREIRLGMPASDVASILGSPNIVSLDQNKDEVWIYDKISSNVEYNCQSSGVWLIVLGGGSRSGREQKSQKTLTIIVKFDENKQVKDFTYHASSF